MITFSKKLIFLSCCLLSSIAIAKKTKRIQLLIEPNNPAFFFALNDGSGIIYTPATSRIQGAYYIANPFILPGGTISKNQVDFSFDKHGNPLNLNSDSIGIAYIMETMLQTFDFNNLPPAGTVLEMSQWQFLFKHECDGDPNSIFSTGFAIIETLTIGQGQSAFEFHLGVSSGLGCNENIRHNNLVAKAYISSLGQTLIKVKFDEEIEYKE